MRTSWSPAGCVMPASRTRRRRVPATCRARIAGSDPELAEVLERLAPRHAAGRRARSTARSACCRALDAAEAIARGRRGRRTHHGRRLPARGGPALRPRRLRQPCAVRRARDGRGRAPRRRRHHAGRGVRRTRAGRAAGRTGWLGRRPRASWRRTSSRVRCWPPRSGARRRHLDRRHGGHRARLLRAPRSCRHRADGAALGRARRRGRLRARAARRRAGASPARSPRSAGWTSLPGATNTIPDRADAVRRPPRARRCAGSDALVGTACSTRPRDAAAGGGRCTRRFAERWRYPPRRR